MIPIQPILFNTDNELWTRLTILDIDKNRYMISTHGNIYDFLENKMIRPSNHPNGYISIFLLTEDGGRKSYLVHRLVALSFIYDPNPDRIQVNHKNGVKAYNHEPNLEWSTPKENTQHAFRTGLANNVLGENNHFSKFTDDQVIKICKLLEEGKDYSSILHELNIEDTDNNRDMIGNIKRRKAWMHISKDYNFPETDARFSVHDKAMIENICKCLEDGLNYKEIFEAVFNKPYLGSRINKKEYELIRRIKNKKLFTDVSKKYDF